MKYSYKTLKRLIPNLEKYSITDLEDRISLKLAEVESITDISADYKGLKVARVLDIKKHPESNKLYVINLDIGNKTVQVVAGAGNMKKGDFVPYTPVGVKVPRNAYPERFDGIVKAMKLAGIMSEGMLNSEFELKISENHDGILILNDSDRGVDVPDLFAGQELAEALGFDDYLIEIENKAMTHRGDVFAHVGFAYELSAILGEQIDENWVKNMLLSKELKINTEKVDNLKLGNVDKACLRYKLVYLELGDIKESPLWLKVFLSKFELGVINYPVDLTNYFALLMGQPMHAFDLDKLQNEVKSKDIVISVEKISDGVLDALDGKQYKITKPTLTILANNKPVAFAGVIGGAKSAIDADSKHIVLEVATFLYSEVRRTMMLYGLNTLSSVIYSRQQDPTKVEEVANMYINMLSREGGVKKISLIADKRNVKLLPKKITLTWTFIKQQVPIKDLTKQDVIKVLRSLRCDVTENNDVIQVVPPVDRIDLKIKEDIIEEIVRILGYERLEIELPKSQLVYERDDIKALLRELFSAYWLGHGYSETESYSFMSLKDAETIGYNKDNLYEIINAKSPDVRYFRPHIFPLLIRKVTNNLMFTDLYQAFEIGHVAHKKLASKFDDYLNKGFSNSDMLPKEALHLSIILSHKKIKPKSLIWQFKKDLESNAILRNGLKIVNLRDLAKNSKLKISDYWKKILSVFNEQATGVFVVNNNVIGVMGLLSSRVTHKLGLPSATVIAELDLGYLIEKQAIEELDNYQVGVSSNYPAVVQDFSIVAKNTEAESCFRDVVSNIIKNIESKVSGVRLNYKLFDIYYLSDKEKVFTIRMWFISNDKQLKDAEIENIRVLFKSYLQKNGLSLRDNVVDNR